MTLDQDEFYHNLLAERGILLGFIHSLVHDTHLAEDIFQTVLVTAINKRRQIKDPSHLQAWLRKAARLEAMNVIRKRNSQSAMDLSEPVLDLLEEQWAERDRQKTSGKLDALNDCLQKLTAKAKALVRLRYSDGLRGAQLAAAVGSNVNNVNVSLTRIHRSLRECMKSNLSRKDTHG